jgi:lysophospholipase L1-like esterase
MAARGPTAPPAAAAIAQRLALVGLGVLAGLAVAEGGLRLWARTDTPLAWMIADWDPDGSRVELLGDACFRGRPGTATHYRNGTVAHVNRLGYRGPEVAVPKPPGTYRVVLLGGSTSHGCLVDDDETIDAHLRATLAARVPERRVEVVNLGLDGLDALCDRERLRLEGLALEPDAVIIHDGVNDVLGVRAAALDADDPGRGYRAERRASEERRAAERGWWRRIRHALVIARMPGIVRSLLRPHTPAAGPAAPSEAGLDGFEATIRAIVALVPPGVAVLLSTPPSALLHPGPESIETRYVVVDAATTQRYRDALDARMRRVAADMPAARYVPHDLPADAFLDDCHMNDRGNRLLAEDFARALVPGGAAGPP